jgi:hypothetical protein
MISDLKSTHSPFPAFLTYRYAPWDWPDKRNILYVKVMKTGSGTFAGMIMRLANHLNFTRGPRGNQFAPLVEKNWREFVQQEGGALDYFHEHVGFLPFLKNKEFWTLKRTPITITMLRRPYDQAESHFRYYFRFCVQGKQQSFGRRR